MSAWRSSSGCSLWLMGLQPVTRRGAGASNTRGLHAQELLLSVCDPRCHPRWRSQEANPNPDPNPNPNPNPNPDPDPGPDPNPNPNPNLTPTLTLTLTLHLT